MFGNGDVYHYDVIDKDIDDNDDIALLVTKQVSEVRLGRNQLTLN